MKIIYRNKVYEHDTWQKLCLILREEKLSYREIARMLGKSYQTIANYLTMEGKGGFLDYQELNDPTCFYLPDIFLAADLRLPVSAVASFRKGHNLSSVYPNDLDTRRQFLTQYLFEEGLYPGLNFSTFILNTAEELPQGRRDNIIDFYLKGSTDSSSDNSLVDTDRTYRALARAELKEVVEKYKLDYLEREGVIVNGG